MVVPVPSGILDLWTLFVEMIFGNFWIAVIGLALLMYIIMILGKVSNYGAGLFIAMFFMCMAIGYGYSIITIFISIIIMVMFVYSWKGWVDRGGV